jgi:hypothetical protein
MTQSFIDYMMDADTAEAAMKTHQEGLKPQGRSNLFYYYRKMEFNASCTLRFLPISTEVATSEDARKRFLLQKKVVRLRFDNPEVAGSKVVIQIPAMQMYVGGKTENDLVLKQAKALFDESDRLIKSGQNERGKAVREKASYHWTRGEAFAQGFVVRSPFTETDPPENPIRVFELNKQIMNKINAACDPKADPELALRYWPVHGRLGSNFIIKKTHSGEWPSYTDSTFSNTPTPWTEEMKAAIDQHGLWQLEDFLPKRPTDDEYKHLAYIVEQSIAGVVEWNPDWEDDLDTVKVYKTTEDGNDVDPEAARLRVQEAVGRVSGTASNVVVNAMLDTDGEVEPLALGRKNEPDAETPVVTVEAPQKTSRDVRSMIEQIKRGSKKTATADGEDVTA